MFVAGTFFAGRAAHAAAAAADRAGPRGRARRLGLGPGRVRRRLHDPLHDLPHPPRRACDGLYTGPRLLARPARGRPRRRVAGLLRRRAVRGRVAGAAARRGRRRGRGAPADAAAACSWSGRSWSRWSSTRGRARSSPGSCCTRCCRCSCWPGSGSRRSGSARRRWYGTVGAVAVACSAFAYAGYASFLVNAEHRADPRELLVSTQSSEEVARRRRPAWSRRRAPRRRASRSRSPSTPPRARRSRGRGTSATSASATSTSAQPAPPPDSDVLILTQAARDRLAAAADRLRRSREFPFRVWWVRDYGAMSPAGRGGAGSPKREPWNPTGGMPEWLYERPLSHASRQTVVPVAVEDLLAELVPLGEPGVAVRRPLDRPEHDVVDAVAADQLARLRRGRWSCRACGRPPRGCRARGPTAARGPGQPSTVGRPVKVEMRAWPKAE